MSAPVPVLPSHGGLKNNKWRYRSCVETDIRKTFQRARAQQQKKEPSK
jgi:predicted HAD superfamily Cof-like phosphohydrolase